MKTRYPSIFGLLLGILLVFGLLLMAPGVVRADDPTVVNVNWNGSGTVTGSGTVGAGWNGAGTSFSQSSFATSGSLINGSYSVTTQGKTTYDVWGDTAPSTTSAITASVADGYAQFQNQRTGMTPYDVNQGRENTGQLVYAYVQDSAPSGGSVSFDMSSHTDGYNLANTSGGFNASSSNYLLQALLANNVTIVGQTITPTSNWASFLAEGNGTANVDLWHSSIGYYDANQVEFGWGMGCYTDADAAFTGSGDFVENAVGTNQIKTEITDTTGAFTGWNIVGNGTLGSAAFSATAHFVNGATIPNYSLTVK